MAEQAEHFEQAFRKVEILWIPYDGAIVVILVTVRA